MSKEVITITENGQNVNYKYPEGAFIGFTNNENYLIRTVAGCRETFQGYFSQYPNNIAWIQDGLNIERLNEFFELIEKKLKLKDKVTFHPTNYNNIVLIVVPPFWRDSLPLRQFFTMFIRCGAVHFKDDLESALDLYSLTREIRPTVDHFLNKNIKVTYDTTNEIGLVQKFKGAALELIKNSFTGGKALKIKKKTISEMVLVHRFDM